MSTTNASVATDPENPPKGPMFGTIWFFLTLFIFAIATGTANFQAIYLVIGWRSMLALTGYFIMQVGLWHAEFKWDEAGSAAWCKAAGLEVSASPEELEKSTLEATIPEDELKAAFPVPWGFLVGWWVWGLSYLFPLDGSMEVDPSPFGIVAMIVCFFVSFVASVPMSKAVMYRDPKKKKMLSLMFLIGWILLGIMSALDVINQNGMSETLFNDGLAGQDISVASVWTCCLLGPITIIISQKILFGSRKMGTFWEESGRPNFRPIVYNMGGPLFVWGWFFFLLGQSGIPYKVAPLVTIYPTYMDQELDERPYIPLFCNVRTLISFLCGCGMVPVVRFLDYSHDEDAKWLGENSEGKVFSKWWLGTEGKYFGVFLESPWPFVIMWFGFGFSSFFGVENDVEVGIREILLLLNCLVQGVDAGILIQQNLYAGNMAGKNKFSKPFLLLFIALAINIGSRWDWHALALSLPGAILIVLGQKTVFGARKRGDYTMQNDQKPNPYEGCLVYSWGEVFFMAGWIFICWGMALPTDNGITA